MLTINKSFLLDKGQSQDCKSNPDCLNIPLFYMHPPPIFLGMYVNLQFDITVHSAMEALCCSFPSAFSSSSTAREVVAQKR